MTCMAFYKSVYEIGCVGSGETCERCVPLITHPYLLLLGIGVIALGLIVIGLILNKYSHNLNEG